MVVKSFVERTDGLTLEAECENGQDAFNILKKTAVDILFLDVEMPGMTGLELAASMARAQLRTRVLIITTFARHGYVQRAKHLGVHGYLLKDAPSHELAEAIRSVARGERVFDAGQLAGSEALPEDPLSDRDRRILRLVEQGMTNKEIAEQMNLSPGTVRNYLNETTSKLDASNRIEAFRKARENGWL